MSAEHTPGPWTILPNTPHFVRAMHPTEGMQPVATVYHFDGELAANARLIAAAPTLLEALEAISSIVPEIMSKQAEDGFRYHAAEDAYRVHLAGLINQARTQASAAIAKAKGGAA